MKSNFSNQYYIYNFLFPCQEGVALKTLCSVYSNEGEYMGKCGIGRTIGYSKNRQLILFWLPLESSLKHPHSVSFQNLLVKRGELENFWQP